MNEQLTPDEIILLEDVYEIEDEYMELFSELRIV